MDRRLESIQPITSLGDTLERLHITIHPSVRLDLSTLPKLKDLAADWDQVRGSISAGRGLRSLVLGRYDQPDLEPLTPLTQLRRLIMTDRPRLRSLSGLSRLQEIETLHVPLATNLKDTTALRGREGIVDLSLEGCTRVSSAEDLAKCVGLQKLSLSECGDLASLGPLRDLVMLESLYAFGSTNVLDGDLSPLAGLPRLRALRMRNRRHYRPSVNEIQAAPNP